MDALIRAIEKDYIRELPDFNVGDTIRVHTKVVEGGKERIQIFEGVVIGIRGGGTRKTFTVRKIASNGIGVERIFPYSCPSIEKIEIVKRGKVRRAKLNYLRGLVGRKARIKEKRPRKNEEK
ncbi:MAG: 50S ribosomal protein L19 [Thermotogae bacterium]|nr:50S ribosomal protein L19 [Thermotogota bacterium]